MIPLPVSCTFADGAYTFGVCTAAPPVVPDFINQLVNKVDANQYAEFQFQMGATPKEILAGLGNGKNPFAFVMQGLAVRKNIEMWDGFVATLVKMMTPTEEGEEPNELLMKMLLPMLPAYLVQFRGTLDIDVDEEAVEEIWQTVREMAPEEAKKFIEGDNAAAMNSLSNAKAVKTQEENPFKGKSNMEIINSEDGPWAYIAGHKDVKTPQEAVQLFTLYW